MFIEILNRTEAYEKTKRFLSSFDTECQNVHFKKALYFYGSSGCGKTYFVNSILKELNYDVISYDAGNIRNKALIDGITSNNISRQNVLHMMLAKQPHHHHDHHPQHHHHRAKPIAIVMDEIDGMNNGDKGGITSLIKIIRQKKTKKQKLEGMSYNPIICIGNYNIDKKIKELMKVCEVIELKMPTDDQISRILDTHPYYSSLFASSAAATPATAEVGRVQKQKMIDMINGDLRKLCNLDKLIRHNPDFLKDQEEGFFEKLFYLKRRHHLNVKETTLHIMNTPLRIADHSLLINETDRTIVALLYHENVIDLLKHQETVKGAGAEDAAFYVMYKQLLDNICYSDYIDRITFQNQIWIFNEMTSLVKTFYTNCIYHSQFLLSAAAPAAPATPASAERHHHPHRGRTQHHRRHERFSPGELRFTKVLTKYSTEYNNHLFLSNMSISLQLDHKDLLAYFQDLRLMHGSDHHPLSETTHETFPAAVLFKLEKFNVSKLDMKRIYRFLDKKTSASSSSSAAASSSSSSSASSSASSASSASSSASSSATSLSLSSIDSFMASSSSSSSSLISYANGIGVGEVMAYPCEYSIEANSNNHFLYEYCRM